MLWNVATSKDFTIFTAIKQILSFAFKANAICLFSVNFSEANSKQ